MSAISMAFTYSGNSAATLNTLTGVQNPNVSKSLADLSAVNYDVNVDQRNSKPNSANQLIFMNQPMSWWLQNLNSGAVKYFPFSNHVNWAFTSSSGDVHIDNDVSSLFIPDMLATTSVDSSGKRVIVFQSKLNLGRTDTRNF